MSINETFTRFNMHVLIVQAMCNWVLREITWPVNDAKTWPTKIAYQLTVNVIA